MKKSRPLKMRNATKLFALAALMSGSCIGFSATPAHAAFEFISPITPQSQVVYEPEQSVSGDAPVDLSTNVNNEPLPIFPLDEDAETATVDIEASELTEEPIKPLSFVNKDGEGKIIEGFANDVPLVLAITQIVPPSYKFVFEENFDPSVNINWQGGKPWTSVLEDISDNEGLNIAITDGVVYIKDPTSENFAQQFLPEKKELPSVEDQMRVAQDPFAGEPTLDDQLGITDTSLPIPLAAIEDDGIDIIGDRDGPVEVVDQVQPIDTGAPVEPIDLDALSFGEPVPLLPELSDVNVDTIVGDTGYSTISSEASIFNRDRRSEQLVDRIEDPRNIWKADHGQTLRQILKVWAEQMGVSLVWTAKYDYPLQTSIAIQGSFLDAVQQVLDGLSASDPRPLGRLHKNNQTGKPVLVIETEQLTG